MGGMRLETSVRWILFGSVLFGNVWWGWRDSNSHTLRRWNLNPVRLPIPPQPLMVLRVSGWLLYPFKTI